jgi:hypothetical protein
MKLLHKTLWNSMKLYETLWRIPIELCGAPYANFYMELYRNSMELHMSIFYGEILWRFLWIFPLGIYMETWIRGFSIKIKERSKPIYIIFGFWNPKNIFAAEFWNFCF